MSIFDPRTWFAKKTVEYLDEGGPIDDAFLEGQHNEVRNQNRELIDKNAKVLAKRLEVCTAIHRFILRKVKKDRVGLLKIEESHDEPSATISYPGVWITIKYPGCEDHVVDVYASQHDSSVREAAKLACFIELINEGEPPSTEVED